MTESAISRIGAATGVASVVVTFIGFGVHGALPTDTTADAVQTYVKGVSASQAGIGNYLELLGYLLFLAFAAYLYAVGRAVGTNSLHWVNVLGLAAAITYIAASALAIAGQVLMVDWAKAGADPKTVLGAYMLDSAAFTLSFEIAALFLLAVGTLLWTRPGGKAEDLPPPPPCRWLDHELGCVEATCSQTPNMPGAGIYTSPIRSSAMAISTFSSATDGYPTSN